MAAATAAAPGSRRRRRRRTGWSRAPRRGKKPTPPSSGPETSSSPAPGDPPAPLPPGAEVEVRVDDDGFHGSWFEATVAAFTPECGGGRGGARGRRAPARYTVAYSHLLADDGGVLVEAFAPTHIRPRPPPLYGPESGSFPPRFRLHDIVEAFHKDGWWSGVVLAAPGSPGPDAAVTVAFPITREVIRFPARLVRPRRDYLDGDWVPSRAAMVVRPSRAVRVYKVGEKVEVVRDRDPYGYSWFPATIAKVVDDLSYIVEYFDLEEEGDVGAEKAIEYLHWRFIRPAVEHLPRESHFQLGPGAAVEAYCDGAWSPGVVLRAVGEGEYEVNVVGKKGEQVVTKVVELLKPHYKWNGKQWKIVLTSKRRNLRRRSLSGKSQSTPVDVTSSGDEHSQDPESFRTKKSRIGLKQVDAMSAECSGHASFSEMVTRLSAPCKSPESNYSLNSGFSDKNCPQALSHEMVNSVRKNGFVCASPGHSTPQNESIPNSTEETVMNVSDGQLNRPVSGASADDAHDMLSIAELRKKMFSARRNTAVQETQKKMLCAQQLKVKKGISKSKVGKIHPIQELQEGNGASDNIQLEGNISFSSKDIVCALRVSMEGQTTSPDRQVLRRNKSGSSTKVLAHKKLANRKGSKELRCPHSSLDVNSTVKQSGRKKVADPMNESPLASKSAKFHSQEQHDRAFEDTPTITEISDQDDLLPIVPPGFESMYNRKGTSIHGSLLDEEPSAMINNLSQANRSDDVCTDHAATKVGKSINVMETAILSPDCPVQQNGRKVAERSFLGLHNAGGSQCTMDCSPLRSCSASGSSLPSPLAFPQISGHQVLFVKSSPMWPLIEAMDAFKEVPQQPHFLPLREFNPALREGMALGLMVSFADLVKSTREARIENSMEWFEDKISTLCHLEGNGFNVQSLQSTLTKMIHVKSNCASFLEEIDKLNDKIVGKMTSSCQIDALLDEKDRAIAELEQRLGRLRQDSQKIAKEKENKEAELLDLKSACSRFKEAYGDAERQFQSLLADLHRKQLT